MTCIPSGPDAFKGLISLTASWISSSKTFFVRISLSAYVMPLESGDCFRLYC